MILMMIETLSTVTYIVNIIEIKEKFHTPYHIWFGQKPNLSKFKMWDCKTHVLISMPLREIEK